MRFVLLSIWVSVIAITTTIAGQTSAWADSPDDALVARMAASVVRGQPVVVQTHVALCDNSLLRCGGHGLGDGDSLRTNLYWATTEGLRGWLVESRGPWKLVGERPGGRPERLLVSVWRRSVAPSPRWRALGVVKSFDVYLVIDVWRGTAIDAGVAAWVQDLQRDTPRTVEVDGRVLPAGGAATIVAYVGHNRWMDDATVGWRDTGERTGATKGVVAIACYSKPYLKPRLARAGHVALVLTNDFVMASGAALVGGLDAFFEGRDLAGVRQKAAEDYARAGKKDANRVAGVFVNSAAKSW